MKNTITHKIVILIWVMKQLFFYHKCFGMTTFLKWLLNPNKGGPNFLFWKKNVRYLRKMIFAFGRFRRRQHLSSSLTDSSRGLSRKIREIFAKYLRKICEIFAKNTRKIYKKFAKNLRKIRKKNAKNQNLLIFR